jgi:phosphoribosylaminoimidazolecarboxamide formyltransferase / IMP cyclohydrolase
LAFQELARDIPSDQQDLVAHSIAPISIVVCDLYPFTATIARPGCMFAGDMEEIDIGGAILLRAAANMKNHVHISVLSGPADSVRAWKEVQKYLIPQFVMSSDWSDTHI